MKDPSSQESALDPDELRRYGRHFVLPEVGLEGQERLKASRVLLVGAGGLGSPLGLYLAAAGVGTLGLVDDDRVDETNLQRQVLYGQSDLGRLKIEAAVERLGDLNPHVRLEPHAVRLDAANARELVEAYDLVVDGSDNFPTRYLVNDACVLVGKPNVWGAILRFEGQLSVFATPDGPCYRCLFPEPPPAGTVPSCAEGGVLGILPGIIGTLQANEVVKLLLGIGEPMIGRLLLFDALRLRFREMRLAKRRDCPVCGDRPSIKELVAYDATCETDAVPAVEPESSADDPQGIPFEISVDKLDTWRSEDRDIALLDVREPVEHRICHLENARLVPLRELPGRLEELDRERPLVVYCHHGIRSAQAVMYLRQKGLANATNLAGGIDAWSLRVDPSVPRY